MQQKQSINNYQKNYYHGNNSKINKMD